MPPDGLNRDDLVLLMDSYKKQVEVNTQIQNAQSHLLSKMNMIIDIQKRTCEIVEESSSSFSKGLNLLVDRMSRDRVDNVRDHSAIKNRIYISMIGMVTIIATLIALFVKG